MTKKELEFLKESNAIEGVFDEDSLEYAELAWNYLKKQKEITVKVILETHRRLMLNQPLPSYQRGHFRKVGCHIGHVEGLDWTKIEARIEVLALNMYLSPENWKRHHIEYEQIHPFADGNGRTGRMFMNWERLKVGLPLKVIKRDDRFKYYEWFK